MTSSLKSRIAAGGLAAVMAVGTLAMSAPAEARNGGAIAAGVVGGLALGAIAGSAAANSGYGYNNGYAPAPAYAPVYGGGCYLQRQPVYDEDGYVVGHRRVRVCE